MIVPVTFSWCYGTYAYFPHGFLRQLVLNPHPPLARKMYEPALLSIQLVW